MNVALAVRLRAVTCIVLLTAAIGALLTGCSDSGRASAPTERPLTAAEANRLATIRFNNYQRGVVPVKVAVRVNGDDVILAGDADMPAHRAYATFTASGDDSSAGLIQWTLDAAAVLPNGATAMMYPPPTKGWTSRPLDPSASRLDAALAVVLSLSADRPENASLLQQSGAAYVRSTTVRGHNVDVFRGPSGKSAATPSARSRSMYFVDETAILRRLVMNLAGDDAPLVVDFLDGAGRDIPLIPALDTP